MLRLLRKLITQKAKKKKKRIYKREQKCTEIKNEKGLLLHSKIITSYI